MKEKTELRGSQYAMLAVSKSLGLILFVVFLIRFTTKPDVVQMLIHLFQRFPIPIIIGILSLYLSAYYFGKKAGFNLWQDIKLGSSIGLTTALQVLAVLALSVSLAVVIQISWQAGFHPLLSIYFLLRNAVPIFILGLPFAFIMGYGFGMVLKNKLKNTPI